MMDFWFVKWSIIIAIFVGLIHVWVCSKSYVFTDEAVATIAKKYMDAGKTGKFDLNKSFLKIHNELMKKYPGHILPEKDLQWIFMNAGGWMGSMCLLHASLTEYVLFFGTAVETSGHSGRYWANITDTLLTGEFHQWQEGEFSVHVYKPGDTVPHVWGEVTAVNFKSGTWMVEYGRGFIPSTLTFALADTIFSTTDFMTLFQILKVYGKAMFLEAGHFVVHLLGR